MLAAIAGPTAPDDWRGALPHHLPHRPGAGQSASGRQVELGPEDHLRCDRQDSRQRESRSVGASRQSSRCLGERSRRSDLGHGRRVWKKRGRSGELMKQGWRPKRTIIYCAWDGEEPGLLGSTEWVEEHQDELRQHAVIYLNTDSSARGYLNISGSHTLERAANQVEREIQDPEKHITVWKRAYLRTHRSRQQRRRPRGAARSRRPAHRRAGRRLRLHGFPRLRRSGCVEHGLWRRKRRRSLSLHLRRLLLVHAFRRHEVCL